MKNESATCPHKCYPESSFWSKAVASKNLATIQPMLDSRFKPTAEMKIASAGSCFAQHIARQRKYTYFITEGVPPFIPEAVATKFNYGVFTARFGTYCATACAIA
jgi:hypothetical protein